MPDPRLEKLAVKTRHSLIAIEHGMEPDGIARDKLLDALLLAAFAEVIRIADEMLPGPDESMFEGQRKGDSYCDGYINGYGRATEHLADALSPKEES